MVGKGYIAGMDIGTTGAKTIIFDLEGNPISSAYKEYRCYYPKPTWVEQDAREIVDAALETSREAVAKAGISPKEIMALGASTQRACAVMVDSKGEPLLMISWQDARTTGEVEQIRERIGDARFYEITGMANKPMWMVSKLLYVRNHLPEIWEKTCRVVQVQDYLLKCLGADEFYLDEAEAALTGLWDTDHFCWSEELLEKLEIHKNMLSKVVKSGVRVGAVSGKAAEISGFAEGTSICSGLGDQNSASIGAGVVQKGRLSVSLGTGGEAVVFLDQPYRDPEGLLCVCNHGIHGAWQLEALQNGSAGIFRWFRDELCQDLIREAKETGRDIYDCMTEKAQMVPPGSNGVLLIPHFAGAAAPRWDTQARGVLLGMTLAHGREHLVRAFMEGIILEQKDILCAIKKQGIEFQSIRVIGGPTKSVLWNQIQADIYGMPVETLKVKDAAVLGGAMAGAVGIGLYSGFYEAAQKMVKVDRRYEPLEENKQIYQELYEIYVDALLALKSKNIYGRIAKLQK